jgi:hypothetical protein
MPVLPKNENHEAQHGRPAYSLGPAALVCGSQHRAANPPVAAPVKGLRFCGCCPLRFTRGAAPPLPLLAQVRHVMLHRAELRSPHNKGGQKEANGHLHRNRDETRKEHTNPRMRFTTEAARLCKR